MLGRFKTVNYAALTMAWLMPAHAGSGALESYGDVGRIAIPAIAAMIAMAKQDAEGLKQFSDISTVTFGTVYGLKRAVNRERPDGGPHSFPSGHTSAAFAGASYLHYRYGLKYGLPAYLAASAVAASRVDARRHHWTDVLAGAVIANLFAYYVVNTDNDNITLTPHIETEERRFMLNISIRFLTPPGCGPPRPRRDSIA